MKKILILGGGTTTTKRLDFMSLTFYTEKNYEPADITTVDVNSACSPTFVHDLNKWPWPVNEPYEKHEFDEVHAYEILEHLGKQGDIASFFETFREIWRALKPDGLLFASCPSFKSLWAWGDPGHTRIINAGSLVFLCKSEYAKQLGKTSMTDYRHLLMGDWKIVNQKDDGESFRFVMKAK
jgi:hypothetical protein